MANELTRWVDSSNNQYTVSSTTDTTKKIGPLPVSIAAGGSVSGTATDRSGSIASGGVAQNAAASLATRRYFYIENPITGTEVLWFSFDTTAVAASPSIGLSPGQAWENPAHFCPTAAVSVIAATTASKWTAKEA